MAQLVPLATEEHSTILVEAAEPAVVYGQSSIQEAGAGKDAAAKALDAATDLSSSIQSFCARAVSGFSEMAVERRPTKAIVEFGLSISVEGNVYVVKGSGQATVKVTAEWDFSGRAGHE